MQMVVVLFIDRERMYYSRRILEFLLGEDEQ
jgi:hypothetical protein